MLFTPLPYWRTRRNDPGKLTGGRLQHAGDLGRRSLQKADDLAPELVERRQLRQGFHAFGIEHRADRTPPRITSFSFSLA